MARQRLSLGRIMGIPVGLDPSWFLIFALLTWTLAVSYFPSEFRGWPQAQYWIVGAVTALMLFVSVVLHELGHSFVALRYKIPVRSITLYIFGGVAQIGSEPPSAISEFFIALAGPLVSFALAVGFRLMQPLVSSAEPVFAMARYLAIINGSLMLFNLIPGFPLDGGRVLRAIIWATTRSLRKATLVAANVGRGIAFLFILYGVFQLLTGSVGNGLWIAFIGWFLENAASAQLRHQATQKLLAGHKVSDAMRLTCATIPAETRLRAVVDEHILQRGERCLVVQRADEVVGLLTLHQIKDVPREDWSQVTADQAMLDLDHVIRVTPDSDLSDALASMDRDGVNQLPVIEAGHLAGVLSREDLITYLRMLEQLSR